MDADDQQRRLEAAFDRIEATILPCIGMMLDTLLEAAELAESGASPEAYAAQLRAMAEQLSAATQAMAPPPSAPADQERDAAAA